MVKAHEHTEEQVLFPALNERFTYVTEAYAFDHEDFLNEHMRLHITKENELLIPKLEAEFDLDEKVRIAGAMAGISGMLAAKDDAAWADVLRRVPELAPPTT